MGPTGQQFRFCTPVSYMKFGCFFLLCCLPLGCSRNESVRTYTPPELERGSYEMDRMLGAIVPIGETTWFFKLQGKDEAVYRQMDEFVKFIQTVRAPKKPADSKSETKNEEPVPPTWTAPANWTERKPTNQLIHRTYVISNEHGLPLKLDVSMLPTPERGFDDRYLKDNISRWCRQYSQEPISEKEIPEHSTKIELKELSPEGGEAWIVNLSGVFAGSPAMSAPPPSDESDPHAGLSEPVDPNQPAKPTNSSKQEIQVKIPSHWKPGKEGGIIRREVSLAVGEGEAAADIFITRLPASVNDLASNISRWRGQVALPDIPAAETAKDAQEITVDGVPGHFVELIGPDKTILAAMVKKGEDAWFFKLLAPKGLAEKEKATFREFVTSSKLP